MALGACVLIASMPFSAIAFVSYLCGRTSDHMKWDLSDDEFQNLSSHLVTPSKELPPTPVYPRFGLSSSKPGSRPLWRAPQRLNRSSACWIA